MNQPRSRRTYLLPALLLVVVLVVAGLALQQSTAVAVSPPPDVPPFTGEPVTFSLPAGVEAPQEEVVVNVPQQDWQVVFQADFESVNWENRWLNVSLSGEPYKWGTRPLANPLDPQSDRVAWSVGGGEGGGALLNPANDGYPPNVNSWLVAGPFNLSEAVDAQLSFDYFFEADVGDTFGVGVSTDGSTFTGLSSNSGGAGSWVTNAFNLNSYAGEPQVWISFVFQSDNSPNPGDNLGVLLDNVVLRAKFRENSYFPVIYYGVTPTPVPPTPTPTVTPPAGDVDYFTDFTNSIDGWEARRYTNGTSFELRHRGDCDEGRCGFLELAVNNDESYVIVSPLVRSRPYPYNIEIMAKLKDEEDQQSYGIIFGGNWNGEACPQPGWQSCFTEYYELRVRYRSGNGNPFLEYKLKRVQGHDSNNQNFGPDIIDWTKVRANPDSWVEWDVNVSQSGTIRIAANNRAVGEIRDTTLLNNRYFGLMVRNGPNGGARVKFDYYKVDWPQSFYQLYP